MARLLIVAVGIVLLLYGVDLRTFPAGKNLANQFVRRGTLGLLLPFGFAIGFAASVAEPAVIAVAGQAQLVSGGRTDGLVLCFVIAVSVGLVIVVGILRVLRGWAVYKLLIGEYAVVLGQTYARRRRLLASLITRAGSPPTSSVFLIFAAIGLGLANFIRGRRLLADGFGSVALCVMVP